MPDRLAPPNISLLTFPLPGLAATMAQLAEDAGWDGLYFADTQNLTGEVYVSLGLAAGATSRIALGTGVTNPVTRHPATTASAIATVHAASGGRAVLGLGRGDSSLSYLGQQPASPAAFETYVATVRGYLHGDAVTIDGFESHNEWIAQSGLAPVPIEIAATGPKVIGIAARHADRVTFAVGADPDRLAASVDVANQASADAGRPSLSLGAYVNVAASSDVRVARELVRGGTAAIAHFSGMRGAPTATLADREVFQQLGANYDPASHAKAGADHSAALGDEFVDRFAVAGTPEQCVKRLGELLDAGVDRLVLMTGSRDADRGAFLDSMNLLANEVLPALRKR